MAQAVHYFERLTSQVSNTSTTFTTALTVSAADLSGAGFVNNDEVLLLVWGLFRGGAAGAAEARGQVTYNGSLIGNIQQTDSNGPGSTGLEQNLPWLFRLDLATLADIDLDVATNTAATACTVELATITVVRLADFGSENTDWWWNENTSLTALTNTMVSFATKTFTPAADDYVVLSSGQFVIDTVADNLESQLRVDGAVVYGPVSEEGESANEELARFHWHAQALTNASHTVDVQARDDSGATTNDHRSSNVFIFRRSAWSDIYTTLPGTVSVAGATDVQIATLTDTLSTSQDLIFCGLARKTTDATDQQGFMWVRSGGSTILDPVADDGSGISNWASHDGSDLKNTYLLGFQTSVSGTLDYDLFIHDNDATTLNALDCRFMVWGMNLASAAITGTGSSTLDDVTSAGSGSESMLATGSTTLDGVTSAGSGSVVNPISGTGASTLAGVTSAGVGVEGFTATGASTLAGVSSAGAGVVANPVSGTGSSTLAGVTSSGSGVLGIIASGSSSLDGVVSQGSGTVADPVTGTGSSTLDGVTSQGTGEALVPGHIENVVCDLLGPVGECEDIGPSGDCDSLGPLCVGSITS
jgi:hypothetical protein